jgi:hypothetical protein
MLDVDGRLGRRGGVWLTSALSLDQMSRLLDDMGGPPSMPEVVGRVAGGSAWAIGAKSYATFGLGARGAQHVITLAVLVRVGPVRGGLGRVGRGLGAWLTGPAAVRFHVDGVRTHGTSHLEYPMKGDQYVNGPDPRHPGGDAWVASLAVEVMRRESSWRVLMLTMGGVDKVGHMLGEYAGPVDAGQDSGVHLAKAVSDADAAVGRVLAGLEETGAAARTLVVLTSDHGGLGGWWVGDRGPGRASSNWYWGRAENEAFTSPSRAIAPLAARPEVAFVTADAMVRAWLRDTSDAALVAAAAVARTLPGVREVHVRKGSRWTRLHRNGPEPASGSWHARHVPELLASYAAGHAPHLVAMLQDGVTYGTPGDHGGQQELSQRIPLVFRGPGVPRGREVRGPARLVDVTPTILSTLGLPVAAGYDGRPLAW